MSVDTLLVVVFPFDGTKLGFVKKQEEIIIEVHKTQELYLDFLSGVGF